MVRTYKTKTERNNISEQAVRSAKEDVLNGNRYIREAAEFHGLKKSMLHKRLQKIPSPTLDIDIPSGIGTSKYNPRPVFSSEEETLLVDYLIKCSKMNGLSYKQVRDFTYFGTLLQVGIDWMKGFMKHHDESGITTVFPTHKVVLPTGAKQVGQCVSAEWGELVKFCANVTA
ncbi:hypothetical protein PR048_020865 [Dryococelus australis]|uniref:HTH psq-type domain-containing protein n=1 Tax=Dryococelus australis TaxID=614101 RepID=A0ABQ9GWL5_9NEOP|nr:hypothetical protein PR048_020865 [Dryococelus australis]